MTLDHKTSHKGQYFLIGIYYIIGLNKPSVDLWFVRMGQYLTDILLFEYLESKGANIYIYIEKIAFKVVQM